MFGNYYAYDSIGPLADSLQRLLGFTDTQIGTLNAIYSFPNIIMVLIGGIIVDRIGTRQSTLLFAASVSLGALLTAISPSLPGHGRRPAALRPRRRVDDRRRHRGHRAVVRRPAARLRLRRQPEHRARRLLRAPTCRRPGPSRSTTRAGSSRCWLACGLRWRLACSAPSSTSSSSARRRSATRSPDRRRPTASSGATCWRFDRSYWYVVGLCVTFYSVIFPFRSTFAIKYFQHAHGLSLQEAGTLNGYVFLAAIFATPAFGLLVDRIGRRALFMAARHVPALRGLPAPRLHPVRICGSRPSSSASPSRSCPRCCGPPCPTSCAPNRLGTAYGLMTMLQNIGLMIFNLAAGGLNDASGAGAENPGRLHADALDVHAPEPLRPRLRRPAAPARDRTARPRPRVDPSGRGALRGGPRSDTSSPGGRRSTRSGPDGTLGASASPSAVR